MMTQTFILGVGMGGSCLAHCGSALLPVLLCERSKRWSLAGKFLLARLIGYLLFAVVVGMLGSKTKGIFEGAHSIWESLIAVLMGLLLLRYGWHQLKTNQCDSGCSRHPQGYSGFLQFKKGASSYAWRTGFLTGISLCTPFLVVILEGLRGANLWQSFSLFLVFYVGTTLVLLPILLGGVLSRGNVIRQIGMMCCLLCGVIYAVQGLLGIAGRFYEASF